ITTHTSPHIRRPSLNYTLFPYTTLFRSNSRRSCVCASIPVLYLRRALHNVRRNARFVLGLAFGLESHHAQPCHRPADGPEFRCLDRKSTRLNYSHLGISYAVFCL